MNPPSPPIDLPALQALIAHDPRATETHHILVHEDLKVLFDSARLRPQIRKEVMPEFPKFGSKRAPKYGYPNGHPPVVADRLRPYTSLIRRLSAHAFAQIDHMEAELIMDGYLPHAVRSSHQSRLNMLTNGSHPVWENWILSLDPYQMTGLDNEIHAWLKEPIDWDEEHLFKSGWDDAFYGAKAANKLFDPIHPKVREYLGVGVGKFELKDPVQSLNLYVLTTSIKEANARAKTLGMKMRFKAL